MTVFDENKYYDSIGCTESVDRIPRDARNISYDGENCSVDAIQRRAIAHAVHTFFDKKYGVEADHLNVHFSDFLDDTEIDKGYIHHKGIMLSVAPHIDTFSEDGNKTFQPIHPFNNKHGLKKFKTVKTDNSYFTAKTWEDVVSGLNEQFKRLGEPDIQIDTELFRQK